MMIIEMRQAAKDKAFDLLDEIKDLGRQKKMVLCELEETLYDCFESSEEDEEEDDDYTPSEDMEYRRRGSYRYANRRSMRRGMRDDEHDDMDMRSYRHSMGMRRRDRMGRFV